MELQGNLVTDFSKSRDCWESIECSMNHNLYIIFKGVIDYFRSVCCIHGTGPLVTFILYFSLFHSDKTIYEYILLFFI